MKLGRTLGIFLAFIGGIFAWFAFSMLEDAGFTLQLFAAGPALVILGLAFVLFPGGNITNRESRNKEKEASVVFSDAPMSHKIAWGVALAIGIVVTLVFLGV